MTFYLKFRNLDDPVKVGTESFSNFWCDEGWYFLINRIKNDEDFGEDLIGIFDNTGKKYTIIELLDYLKLKDLNMIE